MSDRTHVCNWYQIIVIYYAIEICMSKKILNKKSQKNINAFESTKLDIFGNVRNYFKIIYYEIYVSINRK